MRVLLQGPHGRGGAARVPELHLAVVTAARQVVLLVGVEVHVPHQLPVGVLDAVNLAGAERAGRGVGDGSQARAPHSAGPARRRERLPTQEPPRARSCRLPPLLVRDPPQATEVTRSLEKERGPERL